MDNITFKDKTILRLILSGTVILGFALGVFTTSGPLGILWFSFGVLFVAGVQILIDWRKAK